MNIEKFKKLMDTEITPEYLDSLNPKEFFDILFPIFTDEEVDTLTGTPEDRDFGEGLFANIQRKFFARNLPPEIAKLIQSDDYDDQLSAESFLAGQMSELEGMEMSELYADRIDDKSSLVGALAQLTDDEPEFEDCYEYTDLPSAQIKAAIRIWIEQNDICVDDNPSKLFLLKTVCDSISIVWNVYSYPLFTFYIKEFDNDEYIVRAKELLFALGSN